MKFLFDLFPVVVFFIAFKLFDVYVATFTTIIATIIQVAWAYFRHKKVDAMLWLSFVLVVVFGGATLLLHDDTFIKWKPTVLNLLLATGLYVSHFVFKKNPVQLLMGKHLELKPGLWVQLMHFWAVFFIVIAGLNLWVAYHLSMDAWANFKLFGVLGLTFLFVLIQAYWLSKNGIETLKKEDAHDNS